MGYINVTIQLNGHGTGVATICHFTPSHYRAIRFQGREGRIVFDRRSTTGLDGTAIYSVNVRGTGSTSVRIKVKLPRDAIVRSLILLAGTEIETKEYQPARTHTDDYPSVRVEFLFESQVLSFESTSQGKGRIPWAVSWGEKTWVSDSDHIPAAIEILDEHRQRDVEKGLIDYARTLPVEADIPF